MRRELRTGAHSSRTDALSCRHYGRTYRRNEVARWSLRGVRRARKLGSDHQRQRSGYIIAPESTLQYVQNGHLGELPNRGVLS